MFESLFYFFCEMRAGGAILRAFVEKILVKIPDISIIHSKRGAPLHHYSKRYFHSGCGPISFIQLVRIGFLGLYHSIRYLPPPPPFIFVPQPPFLVGQVRPGWRLEKGRGVQK